MGRKRGGGGRAFCHASHSLFLGVVDRVDWAFYFWFEVIDGREALIPSPSRVESAFVLSGVIMGLVIFYSMFFILMPFAPITFFHSTLA